MYVNYKRVFSDFSSKIKKEYNDFELWNAIFVLIRDIPSSPLKWELTGKLKAEISKYIKKAEIKTELEELLRETLLCEARGLRFDSYMQYIELLREPQKKFWLPRRKQLLPVCNAIQELIDDKLDILTVSLPPGSGKALADDTPVLTRNGWKKHGDLRVGDYVVSSKGKFVEVVAVHPKCEMQYRVTFSNGESLVCHGNHEWFVYNRHRMKFETLSTEYIAESQIETGEPGKRGHRYHFQLPLREPLDCEDKELFVDPYTLGAWLGDGRNNNPDVCGDKNDYQIIEKISRSYPVSWHTTHKTTGVEYYGFKLLRQALQKYGMCHSRRRVDKFIPDDYFTASKKQRLELLAGLIDTDGCKLTDKNGYSFSTAEETLKDSFVKLIATFGWRTSVGYAEPHKSTSGIYGRRGCYTVKFLPTEYVPCVLPRKQLKHFSEQRKIAISKIEKISGIRGNCITVEGGLYCVGNTMLTTHNSTLEIFLHSMMIGANPDKPSLASGHSGILTNSIYDGVLGIISDPYEYLWSDIFPHAGEIITNAKEQTIDLGKKHRFSSLTCRAIGASLTGATRCEQFLTADDLVSGIEEALSVPRLEKLWQSYTNDLKSRKKLGCKELHLATRWSVHDPIGKLQTMYENSEDVRFKCLVVPALDENGESNFNYDYGVGFDTKYFKEMEESLDEASFRALFMNQPIEREGLLYPPDSLKYYYSLPEEEPDGIIAVCDTKDRGKDYCVLPVAYIYGQNYYIEDVICDNSLPEVVDKRLVDILCQHNVQRAHFESNAAGGRIASDVEKALKAKNKRCSVSTKYTTQTKETKIIVNSGWIKEHCFFKETFARNTDYGRFMNMMCTYTQIGKNEHDDAPDAMAMLAEFVTSMSLTKVEVFKRPF